MARGLDLNTSWVWKRGIIGGNTSLLVETERDGTGPKVYGNYLFGLNTASASLSDSGDTFSATGVLVIGATAAVADDNDALAATGALSASGIGGDLAANDAADSVSATGDLVIVGDSTFTDDPDVFNATGLLENTAQQPSARRRGRRVIYRDELPASEPKIVEFKPRPVPVGLAPAQRAIEQFTAERAKVLRRIEAIQQREAARQTEWVLTALSITEARLAVLEDDIRRAEEVERAWLARLREEDDLMMLAA